MWIIEPKSFREYLTMHLHATSGYAQKHVKTRTDYLNMERRCMKSNPRENFVGLNHTKNSAFSHDLGYLPFEHRFTPYFCEIREFRKS